MSSGFITESELAERRRVRQEEWDKVRQPDQPLQAPEEEYDHRSLFERLQEQKQKRDLEYEEAHRLKNMIKGLDDDEVEFLDLVDRSKLEEERKKCLEEAREMAEFRSKVASLQEESLAQRIQQEIKSNIPPALAPTAAATTNHKLNSGKSSQSKLLAGAVVKKRSSESSNDGASPNKRPRQSSQNDISENNKKKRPEAEETSHINHSQNSTKPIDKDANSTKRATNVGIKVGGMTCIGILPGLGHYRTESSDETSDESTDVDDCDQSTLVTEFDLVGRKIQKKKSCSTE